MNKDYITNDFVKNTIQVYKNQEKPNFEQNFGNSIHSLREREAWKNLNSSIIETPSQNTEINRRKRLHELSGGLHCPIIGTCLKIWEIRKVFRQCRIDINSLSDYEIHTTAVHQAKDKNHEISKRLNKLLNKKFKQDIRFYDELTKEQLLPAWKKTLSNGKIPGPFWAMITHSAASEPLIVEVFGDVHMLSHLMGASNRADLQQLNHLEETSEELKEAQDYWRERAQTQKLETQKAQNEITALCEVIEQQKIQLVSLTRQVVRFESGEEIQQLRESFVSTEKQLKKAQTKEIYLENRLKDTEKNLEVQKRYRENLEESLAVVKAENDFLERLFQQGITPVCVSGEIKNCYNLCGMSILYVGGRASLISHYRSLIEENNGSFLHHDGGVEMKDKELDQLISRADIIICPTNCVSHNASFKIKKHCKKSNKCFLMLRSAGLSSLNCAISDICEKEVHLKQNTLN